jgi:membrane-associated phospholipid phosphatase
MGVGLLTLTLFENIWPSVVVASAMLVMLTYLTWYNSVRLKNWPRWKLAAPDQSKSVRE